MSADFDRFLAGEGALAGLIRRQPAFDAPEGLFDRVMTALDCDAPSLRFEPPASLEAAVLAEAARLDAAQRPRRDALLDEIAHGEGMDAAMGTAVSPDTARWLSHQARSRPSRTPPPAKRRHRWLGGLGVAVTAALAASVALKVWFDPNAPSPSGVRDEIERSRMMAAPTASAPVDADQQNRSMERAEPAADAPSTLSAPPRSAAPAPAKPAAKAARKAPTEREQKRSIGAVAVAPQAVLVPAPPPPAAPAEALEDRVAEAPRVAAVPAESAALALRNGADAGVARVSRLARPMPRFEAVIDTDPALLAARLAQHPPGVWELHVSPPDDERGIHLADALTARLRAIGRPDVVARIIDAKQAAGQVLITFRRFTSDAPQSPSSPPPPPAANDG